MRKLFEQQYVADTAVKIAKKAKAERQQAPEIPIPPFAPFRAMNVGVDEVALDGLNKTERRYLEILRQREELVWIGVHTFRLRMAANTHYTPDFATLDKDGLFTMIDTKGAFTREDAQLKIKLAARMFPMFRWVKAELTLARAGKKPRAESLKEVTIKG
jgi:hypothetical protein